MDSIGANDVRHAVAADLVPDDIAGGGIHAARQRVEDGLQISEVARQLRGRGDRRKQRGFPTDLAPLVVEQPEQLVPPIDDPRDVDRTAEYRTPLVLPKRGLPSAAGIPEKVIGVELVVAQEFKKGSVECVGSRLEGHGHVGAGPRTELGGGDVRLDPEFLDGVDGGFGAERLKEHIVVLDAVQREVVDVGTVAVHAEVMPARNGEQLAAGYRAGHQQNQVRVASAVQRQANDALIIDNRPDGGVRGVQ